MKKKLKIVIFASVLIVTVALFPILYFSFSNKENDNLNIGETMPEEITNENIDKEEEVTDTNVEQSSNIETETSSKETGNSKTNTTKNSTSTNTNSTNDNNSSNSNASNGNTNSTNTITSNTDETTDNNTSNETKTDNSSQNETTTTQYIGVPDPNSPFYSIHKGIIDYKVEDYPSRDIMEVCLENADRIGIKNTTDIKNILCVDVVDSQGTILGEYLDISCYSGNCSKYKD